MFGNGIGGVFLIVGEKLGSSLDVVGDVGYGGMNSVLLFKGKERVVATIYHVSECQLLLLFLTISYIVS